MRLSPGKYEIVLDNWHPVRTNQWYGKGWRVRWRLGKAQGEILKAEALNQDVPRALGKRRVTLAVYGWSGKRKMPDADAYTKQFLDGLRTAELITDDDANGVEFMPVQFHRDRKKRTVITLEDVLF